MFDVAELSGFDASAADKLLAQWSEQAVRALLHGSALENFAEAFPPVADRRRKGQALVQQVSSWQA
jgi:hypothetical protein